MYDMYYWDQPDQAVLTGTEHPSRALRGRVHGGAHPGRAGGGTGSAAQAVQVALDRRDNGGDSGALRGK
jgi:hypothetical protein